MDPLLETVLIVLAFVFGFGLSTWISSRALVHHLEKYNLLGREFSDLTNRYILLQTEVIELRALKENNEDYH